MIAAEPLTLPRSCPDWITPELIANTLETWQPYYDYPLTIQEAVDMVNAVGRLWNEFGDIREGGEI